MIEKILVPVDGSKQSAKALEFACNLADKYNANIVIQHTVETTLHEHAMFMGSAGFAFELDEVEVEKAGKQVIEAALKIVDQHDHVTVETVIDHGSPAHNIIQCAQGNKVDMIVMGSRGLSDLGGLLLGSVSHKVSHIADCTCVTVR
ncbi:MAG: universal stress protein [Gammaproteobacteria bacterium]|nr:universal stress protein [Gammaproteobacteria bacterium]